MFCNKNIQNKQLQAPVQGHNSNINKKKKKRIGPSMRQFMFIAGIRKKKKKKEIKFLKALYSRPVNIILFLPMNLP